MKRVKFASGKQKTWLQEVKQRSRMTWNDLALFIGVSRATMFNYLAENARAHSAYVREFLAPLICKLFNKVPKVYEGKTDNTIRCKFYSKRVHDFLTQEIGLPAGKKVNSGKLRIPQSYFKSDICLIACLRGLFDTDGGIYRHREKDPMIEFSSHNTFLSADVMSAFRQLGFKASMSQGKVYIYERNYVIRFFEVVGSRNPRNLFKFLVWKKSGVVPKTSDVRSWSSPV